MSKRGPMTTGYLIEPVPYAPDLAVAVIPLSFERARIVRIRRAREDWSQAMGLTLDQRWLEGDFLDGW